MGASAAAFSPATTTTKSVASARDRIAAERKLSFDRRPASTGGQGSNALSRPMREDSPAARITPAKLGARDMLRKIAESREKVSVRKGRSAGRLILSRYFFHAAFSMVRS